MEVLINYLDDGETTVTFLDGEETIIEVYLRRRPHGLRVSPNDKPFDLSIFTPDKPPKFNVITAPRRD